MDKFYSSLLTQKRTIETIVIYMPTTEIHKISE